MTSVHSLVEAVEVEKRLNDVTSVVAVLAAFSGEGPVQRPILILPNDELLLSGWNLFFIGRSRLRCRGGFAAPARLLPGGARLHPRSASVIPAVVDASRRPVRFPP